MLPKKKPRMQPNHRATCDAVFARRARESERSVWRNATAAVVLVLAYLPLTAEAVGGRLVGPALQVVPVAFLCAGVLMTRAWHQPSLARPSPARETRFSWAWPGRSCWWRSLPGHRHWGPFRSVVGDRPPPRKRRVAAPEALRPSACTFVPGAFPFLTVWYRD